MHVNYNHMLSSEVEARVLLAQTPKRPFLAIIGTTDWAQRPAAFISGISCQGPENIRVFTRLKSPPLRRPHLPILRRPASTVYIARPDISHDDSVKHTVYLRRKI